MEILFALLITACYLIGGQIEKSVRRYGVPTFSFCFAFIADKNNRPADRMRYIWFLGMIGILSIGYGEKSIIRKFVKADWATRLVYSMLLASVFILAGCKFYFAIPILSGAFQIRAGKLFSIGKFDILIEDICRAGAIFTCTFLTVQSRGGF